MELKNARIIVTGGAQGMGAHFAQRLVEAGAHVAVGDVNTERLAELQSKVTGSGKLHTRKLDVGDEEECGQFVEWADNTLGGVNGLINNAGILRDGLLVKKDRETGAITKMTSDQWSAVIRVNLAGATWMVREVVSRMASAERRGVIVNLSSVARHGNRGQTNYVSAKASLAANTVTWAREFAPFGIRVTAVAPGMVETPMTQGMNQKARDMLVQKILVNRIGVPEDIWMAVKFCIECEYLNAQTIDVDGGK